MDYILTVTINPTSTGGVVTSPVGTYVSPGKRKYPAGTVVSITAQCSVSLGYFDHWEGALSGSTNPTTITMNSDKSVIVVFYIPPEAPVCYLTTSVMGNGSIYPSSGTFNLNTQIMLSALPNKGNAFNYWYGDIDGCTPVSGRPNQLIVPMNKDRYISAAFYELPTKLSDLTLSTTYRDYSLGEELHATLTYKYQGVAQDGELQVLIGTGVIFTLVHAFEPVAFNFEYSNLLTDYSADIGIILPNTLTPGQVYSLKVILTTSDGISADKAKGSAFRIASGSVPVDPGIGEYRKVKDYTYPYGDTYYGNASEATAEFSILKTLLPVDDWLSQKVITAFEDEVTKQGGKMLHLDVYEREEGLFSKGYKIVVTAAVPVVAAAGFPITLTAEEQYAMGVGAQLAPIVLTIAVWKLVVAAVLLLTFILIPLIISAIVPSVRDVIWGEEGVVSIFGDLLKILPSIIMLMFLMMMMEMTRGISEPEAPKPVTEAVVKGAKKIAPYVGKGIKKVTEYFNEGELAF